MNIVKGVYFFQSGENTYLRNVNDFKDYLFNEIVWDILSYIKNNPGCNLQELCEHLLTIYDVENEEELRGDIKAFVDELYENGLLEDDDPTPEETELHISDIVSQERFESGQLNSAALELTYRCNEKCIHCYIDDCPSSSENELSLDEYKSVLDQLNELGCINILLTGGEVCLKKEFIEIARYAVSLGFLVDIYTNGIAMTDEQFDAICDMKVNSVSVSMYGSTPAVHDAITKVPGSFEKTLKRVMMFKCAGIDTYIKNVAIKQNLHDLENLYKLGQRIGVDVRTATNISNTHMGVSAAAFRIEDYEQIKKVTCILDRCDTPIKFDPERDADGPVCNAAVGTLSVDPYGNIRPCLAFTTSAGSVRESTVEYIWKNSPFMNEVRNVHFRQLSDKCDGCKYFGCCSVCIGASYEEFGKTFCPNTGACEWAKARYNEKYNNR